MKERTSTPISSIDFSKAWLNPGCAVSAFKPELIPGLLELLRASYGDEVGLHMRCCDYDPELPEGSVILNLCAGCDRAFGTKFPGIRTISVWELLDAAENVSLPDYGGMRITVHDCCYARERPGIRAAVRSLLGKMNFFVEESPYSGLRSVCCMGRLYGKIPEEEMQKRIERSAALLPCENVAVYTFGCQVSMTAAGMNPLYLPELVLGRKTGKSDLSVKEYRERKREYKAGPGKGISLERG